MFSFLLFATVGALTSALSASVAIIPVAAALSARQDSSSSSSSSSSRGSLAYFEGADPLTFQYSTSAPNETNWIAIWPSSEGGPVDGEAPEEPSLLWEYAPETEGSVLLAVEDLLPGEYTAYFLAQDGYDTLAEPMNVSFVGLPADLYFPVEEATLQNAREGEMYSAHVGGLVLGRGSAAAVVFEKVAGDDWIHVDPSGHVSGTAQEGCVEVARANITAVADNGSAATFHVKIPVRRENQHLVESLSVMSYNLWAGGSNVKRYHEKQLRFILDSNVDVIGMQESAGGEHAIRLGQALGWDYWQSNDSVGVISRYPMVEFYGNVEPVEIPVANSTSSPGGGVRINLNGASGDQVNLDFWSAHLHYTPYGPYDFCFDGNTTDQVLANEAFSGREAQIEAIVKRIQEQIDASTASAPVILVGDMNAPSHLDWIESLREKNCGHADVPWPTSVVPTQAGLLDSFRVAHPDPAAEQGTTWSPVYPFNEGNTGPPEPQDRIDFVYGSKGLVTTSSDALMVGVPNPVPDVEGNEWTSDHKAVLTRYRLTG